MSKVTMGQEGSSGYEGKLLFSFIIHCSSTKKNTSLRAFNFKIFIVLQPLDNTKYVYPAVFVI